MKHEEKVKKTFCHQKLFWLFTALLEWIVLVISKILQILGLQPRIFFSINRKKKILTVGQNNFENKIPFTYFIVNFDNVTMDLGTDHNKNVKKIIFQNSFCLYGIMYSFHLLHI